jgi:hypothetical protein
VTARTHDRHRPRVRHRQPVALLQQPYEIPGLDPGPLRERRRLDLSVKPDERLVARAQETDRMSDPTCRQERPYSSPARDRLGSGQGHAAERRPHEDSRRDCHREGLDAPHSQRGGV